MKEEDLRIGNYYIDEDGYEHQVSARDFSWMAWDYCRPIPLTEEWLLKFGFKWDGISYRDNGRYSIIKTKRGFDFGFEWEDYNTPIDYVHQLQNLYHALKGEELTIKQNDEK